MLGGVLEDLGSDSHEEGRKMLKNTVKRLLSYPIDNPYVIELLHRLGFDTVESLLKESDIFTRSLNSLRHWISVPLQVSLLKHILLS